MSFLARLIQKKPALAHPDSYGHLVLLAWEFDPEAFGQILQQATKTLKAQNIKYDLLHQEKPSTELGKLWGSKGNDWSHISIMMLRNYQEADEKKIEELAKQHTPKWSIVGPIVMTASNGVNPVVGLELDYPPEAQAFEAAFRKYAGDRIDDRSKSKYKFVPHASLFGINPEDKEKVEAIMKKLKLPAGKIPTQAIQVWDDFQVADHILL